MAWKPMWKNQTFYMWVDPVYWILFPSRMWVMANKWTKYPNIDFQTEKAHFNISASQTFRIFLIFFLACAEWCCLSHRNSIVSATTKYDVTWNTQCNVDYCFYPKNASIFPASFFWFYYNHSSSHRRFFPTINSCSLHYSFEWRMIHC